MNRDTVALSPRGDRPKETFLGLSTATEVVLCVDGRQAGAKGRFISEFFGLTSDKIDAGDFGMVLRLKAGAESFQVRFLSTVGVEGHLGVPSQVYQLAQGSVLVYDIGDRESFEQCRSLYEETCRAKRQDRVPVMLLGMGLATAEGNDRPATERQVPKKAAETVAKACHGWAIEVWDQDHEQCREQLLAFVKETVSFYSAHDQERANAVTDGKHSLPEHHFAVLGDTFAGKTAFLQKLVGDTFLAKYEETAMSSVYSKQISHKGTDVILNLIDCPCNAFNTISPALLNRIQGIILVYSCTSLCSFQRLEELKERLLSMKGMSKLPTVLVGTKLDLASFWKAVPMAMAKDKVAKSGFVDGTELAVKSATQDELLGPIVNMLDAMQKEKASAIEAIAELDRAGPLGKTTKHLKKFKERQFVIRDSVFYCSADGIVTPKTPRVSLSHDTVVTMLPPDPTRGVFPFEVRGHDGHMIVSAKTEDDRKNWVDTMVGNIAYGRVAQGILEDVVRLMIWEVLEAQGVKASDGPAGLSLSASSGSVVLPGEAVTSPPMLRPLKGSRRESVKKPRLGSFLKRKKSAK